MEFRHLRRRLVRMMTDAATAADTFRQAVLDDDLEGMLELLSPDVRLYNPMTPEPIVGRDQVRPVFSALQRIFHDFRYTRVLAGGPPDTPTAPERMQAVAFEGLVGQEKIEGIDIFDLDDQGRIATFTVMLRPLAGIYALAEAMANASTGSAPGPPAR